MQTEKPVRRMTLRELLTHTEKSARDLIDHFKGSLFVELSDLRDLSHPARRRRHRPSMLALQNALHRLQQAAEEIAVLTGHLEDQVQAIRDQVQWEQRRSNRVVARH
jgi:hypothetical protein